MIQTKSDLKEYIKEDNSWFSPKSFKERVVCRFAKYPSFYLKQYLYYLRKQEYYINTASGSKTKGLIGLYYERKKNKLGANLGIDIGPNCFKKGLQIYHGNIVINPKVRAGEYCKLHGNNCIGNNGKNDISPTLGNGIDIGYGAILIGDIHIADNIIVGANSLVNRSFDRNTLIIAGVPAKVVK